MLTAGKLYNKIVLMRKERSHKTEMPNQLASTMGEIKWLKFDHVKGLKLLLIA